MREPAVVAISQTFTGVTFIGVMVIETDY